MQYLFENFYFISKAIFLTPITYFLKQNIKKKLNLKQELPCSKIELKEKKRSHLKHSLTFSLIYRKLFYYKRKFDYNI